MRPRPPERTAGARPEQASDHRSLSDAEIRRALEALEELDLEQEQLLFRICALSLQRGYAWVGQRRLADWLRCSERHVRDVIRTVRELGYIQTLRTSEGLNYLPQWQRLGLDTPVPHAARDRHDVPMHVGSTSRSDEKEHGRQHARASPLPGAAPERAAAGPRSPVSVPPELLGALRDKLGPVGFRALARLFPGELARASPELSIEALRRLCERREVKNAAGLFITMLRDDLAARDEALTWEAAVPCAPAPACAPDTTRREQLARVRMLEEEVREADFRGDLERVDRLRDEIYHLLGAPSRGAQRAMVMARAALLRCRGAGADEADAPS